MPLRLGATGIGIAMVAAPLGSTGPALPGLAASSGDGTSDELTPTSAGCAWAEVWNTNEQAVNSAAACQVLARVTGSPAAARGTAAAVAAARPPTDRTCGSRR